MRKPASFTGVEQCLNSTAEFYRRNLWASMPIHIEVWCEKDALAGVLMEETKVYDVPLMVAKGYSSISFLHSSAKAIAAKDKPAHIFHFGDLDPSGVDAARDIEAKLRRYAPNAEIHFERPAVTRVQADEWNLPSRPTKHGHPCQKVDWNVRRIGCNSSSQASRTRAQLHRAAHRSATIEPAPRRGRIRARSSQEVGEDLCKRRIMKFPCTGSPPPARVTL
jgi:hypothetical protein